MSSNKSFVIHYEIVSQTSSKSRKFSTVGQLSTVHLYYDTVESDIELFEIIDAIEDVLEKLFINLLADISDDDYLRLSLRSEHLDNEIFLPFRRKENFTLSHLIDAIVKVSQSKKDFLLNGLLELDIITVKPSRIAGGTSFVNFNSWRVNSNKVVQIKSTDGLCLPRAIVVSKAHVDGNNWRRIREDTHKIQTEAAIELCRNAGVEPDSLGMTYDTFVKFQNYFKDQYQLIVVTPPKVFIYKGLPADKQIFVQVLQGHADSLLSIKAFLRVNYWCKVCLKGYMSLTAHRCLSTCHYCFVMPACIEIVKIDCINCGGFFISQKCFENHIKNKVCNNYKYCKTCKKLYRG